MAEYSDIINQVDSSLATFDSASLKAQKKLMEQVMALSKDLDTDPQGNIKTTISNLQKIAKIKATISKIVCSDQYKESVTKLCENFEKVYQKQSQYYKKNFQEGTLSETASKKQKLLRQIAVDNTIEGLTGAGIQQQITDKLTDMLTKSVTSGAKWTDMVGEMKAYLDPDGDGTGAFAKYAKTYATTAMGQFTGQNNKLMTDALDTEWYMYVGSDIETTREFCQHLTHKKYIHVSEIPTILKGDIDGHQCKIYEKTGLPQGMIEGTTPENFQVNVGGWNCRHQLLPIAEQAVPQNIRDKFEKAKQEAIEKQKKEEEKQAVKQELSSMIEQYKDIKAIPYDTIKKNLDAGDINYLLQMKDLVNGKLDAINGFSHIPNALDLAKELNMMQLEVLDMTYMDYKSEIDSIVDPDEKIEYIKDLQASITNSALKPYKESYLADQMDIAVKEKAVFGIKQDALSVKSYVDSHPKSKKIIDLYNEAEEAIKIGDYDLANQKLAMANKQIKSNQSSDASKAKKASSPKEEQKPQPKQYKSFTATSEDVSMFSDTDLQMADMAITAKLNAIAGMPLEYQKKKLLFEISWVEQNKKYPTWKIAQKAYQKKLEDVIYQIDIKPIVSKYNSLVAQNAGNADVIDLLKSLNSNIKAGKPISELQSEIEYIEKVINKAKDEEARKQREKAEEELKKISKDLDKIDLNKPLPDETFWECVKNTIKAEKHSITLTDDALESILKDLKSAVKSKDRYKANECLKNLGWDADDAYGQWRRDSATWVTTGRSASIKVYGSKSKEIFSTCTTDERISAYDYTAGSGFMNRPLRGYDNGWGWDHYKGEGNVSLNHEKATGEKEINDLTELVSRSSYDMDIWIQRGIEPNRHGIRANDALESFLGIRGQMSDGSVYQKFRNDKDFDVVRQCVGKIVTDLAFGSCGASKGTGFNGDIINIYCPKGTKMLYLEGVSAYSGGTENEMLLQRSTSFLITKVEKMAGSGFFYIDCMIVKQDY